MNFNDRPVKPKIGAQPMLNKVVGICLSMLTAGLPFVLHARTLPPSLGQQLPGVDLSAPGATALPQGFGGFGDVVRIGEASILRDENTLIIDQDTAKILLEWASFNIGSEASVHYRQDQNDTAVNIISGESPSKIFGQLTADGQVYLLNPNGIIFGETAQVNVRGLIAAAAKLNGYEDLDSLSEEQKIDFVENSLLDVIGEDKALLLVDDELLRELGPESLPRVVVKPGATIESKDVPVLLAGPEVHNYGTITNENSQVILAGSRKEIYLAVSDNDDNLRGYLVEVNSGTGVERGKVVNGAAAVKDETGADQIVAGEIVSKLGNVTLIADEIIQSGKIEATTAVDVNGSIRILARDQATIFEPTTTNDVVWNAQYYEINANGNVVQNENGFPSPTLGKIPVGTEAGSVTFEAGSETIVTLDNSSVATDSLAQKASRIHVEGKNILLQDADETGANVLIQAQGGGEGSEITFRARENPILELNKTEESSEATLVIGEGVVIDASGTTDTQLDASRNTVEIFVTSNETKDNPEQKNGELLRKTLVVDIRTGTEVIDWESSLEGIERSASERSVKGGSVDMLSTGAVTVGDNVIVDVSGGEVTYEAGFVETSKVVQNGRLVSIADADARISINDVIDIDQSQVTDEKWGDRASFNPASVLMAKRTYNNQYVQGFDAGSVDITAPTQEIAATTLFDASTTVGPYQLANNTPVNGEVSLDLSVLRHVSQSPVNVNLVSADIDEVFAGMYLDPLVIENSGASNFSITSSGAYITLLPDSDMNLGKRGGLDLTGLLIAIQSDIRTVGGDVSFNAGEYVVLDGSIDTSGNWTNNFDTSLEMPVTHAGDIKITALEGISQAEGEILRANGGVFLNDEGDISIGKGGSISLRLNSEVKPLGNDRFGPALQLLGDFEAVGSDSTGSLILSASDVLISGDEATNLTDVAGSGIVLNDDFFQTTKVNNFTFEALEGDVRVADGADVTLMQFSHGFDTNPSSLVTSDDVTGIFNLVTTPNAYASGGSLSFVANKFDVASVNGNVIIEQGANIQGQPGAALSLTANHSIDFNGSFIANGGKLTASLEQFGDSDVDPTSDNRITVGDNAIIDLSADIRPLVGGDIVSLTERLVSAGSINLAANYGSVVVYEDAQIDLSGGLFSGLEQKSAGVQQTTLPVASGSLTLAAEDGFWFGTSVDFGESGLGYSGGSLEFSVDTEQRAFNENANPSPNYLVLGSTESWSQGDENSTLDTAIRNRGIVANKSHQDSYLSALTFNTQNTILNQTQVVASIELVDDVVLSGAGSIILDTHSLNLNGHDLLVDANYIQFGESDDRVQTTISNLTGGEGQLIATGEMIDLLGNFSVFGDQNVAFTSSYGTRALSVLGAGGSGGQDKLLASFTVNGDLNIATPKFWLSSLSKYRIDAPGEINFVSTGDNQEPVISAGGALELSASQINIDTEVHVPFGSIDIKSDELVLGSNSLLSVASDETIPLGRMTADDFFWGWGFNINVQQAFNEAEEVRLGKRIDIDVDTFTFDEQAKILLSGDGRVYAREFVAGIEGSNDVLSNVDYQEQFAIIPTLQAGFAPFDDVEFVDSNIPWGTTFEVSGSEQLADGSYTVLPVNYALMPGAYLVTPLSGSLVEQGFLAADKAGAEIASGQFAAAGVEADNPWSAFVIEPNSVIETLGNYQITFASDFYTGAEYSPGTRPEDTGLLSLNVGELLDFQGQILASDNSRYPVQLDINSANGIVLGTESLDDSLLVNPELFANIDQGQILVGATREWNNGRWEITNAANAVSAKDVVINNEELVIAADSIRLENSVVSATGNSGSTDTEWNIGGSTAAILTTSSAGSSLTVEEGAVSGTLELVGATTISSPVAVGLVYDGTASSNLTASNIDVAGGRLQLLGSDVSVGAESNSDANVDATVFQSIDSLVLEARSGLSFLDDFDQQLSSIELIASTISVADSTAVTIEADQASLVSFETGAATTESLDSNFSLIADNLLVTAADSESQPAVSLQIAAQQIELAATEGFLFSGDMSLLGNPAANLTVKAPVIGASTANSQLSIDGYKAVSLTNDIDAVDSGVDVEAFAGKGRMSIAATDSLTIDTRLELAGGSLTGLANDITLTEQGLINASAHQVRFPDWDAGVLVTETSPAGAIELEAQNDMTIATMDALHFGDPSLSAAGGELTLKARNRLQISSVTDPAVGSGGLDLYVEAGQLDTDSLSALSSFNAAGADGFLEILVTGNDVDLVVADNFVAQNFYLGSALGNTEILAQLTATDAEVAPTIFGQRGLSLSEDAMVSVLAVDTVDTPRLSLQSGEGIINVDDGAQLGLAGGLEIVVAESALASQKETPITLGANDSIAGYDDAPDIVVFSSLQKTETDGDLSATDILDYAAESVTALGSHQVSELFSLIGNAATLNADLLPMVDVNSPGELSVGTANVVTDLTSLRNQNNQPGRLVMRSASDFTVVGGISAGAGVADLETLDQNSPLNIIPVEFNATSTIFPTTVLLADESPSIVATAGAIEGSGLIKNAGFEPADLILTSTGYIRTGTGDISLYANGDVHFEDGAYLAALGKSHTVDDKGLPGWGDYPYFSQLAGGDPSIWLLDRYFSGFGIDSGDINIEVDGNLTGASVDSSLAEFRRQFVAGADFSVVQNIDYSYLDTWYVAIDSIRNGITAIGGGDVRIRAGGDINKMHFSTPSTGVWLPDETVDGQVLEFGGGLLSVYALGDISASSFQNDGGSIDVFSRSNLTEDGDTGEATLLIASDSTINVNAVGDLILEGVINSFLLPKNQNQYSNFVTGSLFNPTTRVPAAVDQLNNYYFSGFDSTSVNLVSVSGDVRSKSDLEDGLAHFFDSSLASEYSALSNAYYLLPSQVAATSMSGDLILDYRGNNQDNVITLFPDALASFQLKAFDSIYTQGTGVVEGGSPLRLYIPDYDQSALPNRTQFVSEDAFDITELKARSRDFGFSEGVILPKSVASDPSDNHGDTLLDRDAAASNQVIALNGSIGGRIGALSFLVPSKLDAYAGQDIVNATFWIQHTQNNDVSHIVAGNNFEYPLTLQNGKLRESGEQFVQIGGPGDLILMAGGDIDLGSSTVGIRSIGNSENRLLPNDGASLHLYAGTGNFANAIGSGDEASNLNALFGASVLDNTQIPLFSNLFSGTDLENATFIDLFMALLDGESSEEFVVLAAELVSSASGVDYGAEGSVDWQAIKNDFSTFGTDLQQRIAVSFAAQVLMENPGQLIAGSTTLFDSLELGEVGLSATERADLFKRYFDSVGIVTALDYLQSPNRVTDFSLAAGANGNPEQFLASVSELPASEQLQQAYGAYQQLSFSKKLLVSEQVLNHHIQQSGSEAANNQSGFANFERGYVAQRLFFGEQYQPALNGIALKMDLLQMKINNPNLFDQVIAMVDDINAGTLSEDELTGFLAEQLNQDFDSLSFSALEQIIVGAKSVDEFLIGGLGQSSFANVEDVFATWQLDSGVPFARTSELSSSGDIDLAFSTIQTGTSGGDINLYMPSGSANVGVSVDLVSALFAVNDVQNSEFGILAFANGSINSIVANAFNVNESRAIPLSGGDVNLWSAYGDIDAGKGAKTAVSTPPVAFDVNPDTGGVVLINRSSVSGSGIQTQAGKASSSEILTPTQRYYRIAEGAGSIYLATPLGVVDAGEAGIQSAGDLFLAAAQVQGADNISAGGISTGVPTSSAVGAEVGGLGAAVDAAAESVQESAERAASESASRATAFVTIELL